MGFLKKIIVSSTAIFLIFFGGAGLVSGGIILKIGALIGLIIGLFVLYMFVKMAWRAMGCLPAILVIIALSLFILYAIGAFSGGFGNITENIKEFYGQDIQTSEELDEQQDLSVTDKADQKEVLNLIDEDKHKIFDGKITDKFLSKKKHQKTVFNPLKYPAVFGLARVLSGDTLVMGDHIIKLYGIAAPDIKQNCAARDGRGYRCGQQSAKWLSEWLADNEIKCHIIKDDGHGTLTGVCLIGEYDIGAAIVNAGWAVANPQDTQIYLAYQEQASVNRRGLWDGKFYMPWDWRKVQNRKANIKIIHKKKPVNRIHTLFFGR